MMTDSQSKKLVRVVYWAGTSQREELAGTYQEAMEIAAKNNNKFAPAFWEIATGRALWDDGNGLLDEDGRGYIV